MKSKTVVFGIFTFLILSAVSGCSKGPSENDIQNMLNKEMANVAETAKLFAGRVDKSMLPEMKVIKKIGCTADGENAYKCDVQVEQTQFGNKSEGIANLRFVQGKDGWLLVKSAK